MPTIGDEVRVLYRDRLAILQDVPEVVYGDLAAWRGNDGVSGIVVTSESGATFIEAADLISVTVVAA